MSVELYANNAHTTLTSAVVTTPAAGTPETWDVVSTALPFPQPVIGTSRFRAVLHPNGVRDLDPEIVEIDNILSGTSWTVHRGAEGSTIKPHAIGDVLEAVVSVGNLCSNLYVGLGVWSDGFQSFNGQIPLAPPSQVGGDLWTSGTTGIMTVGAAGNAGAANVWPPLLPSGVLTLASFELDVSNVAGTEKLSLKSPVSGGGIVLVSNTYYQFDLGPAATPPGVVVESVGSDLAWDAVNTCIKSTAGGQFIASATVQTLWVPTP